MTPRAVWSVTRYPSGCRGELTCSIKILHYNIVCVLGSPEEERQGPFETRWHPSDQEGNYCLLPMIQNRRNALVEPVQGRGELGSSPEIDWQDRYFSLDVVPGGWLTDLTRTVNIDSGVESCAAVAHTAHVCLSVPHRHGAGALLPEHLLQHPPHR